MILWLVDVSSWDSKCLKILSILRMFSGHFSSISGSKFPCLGLPNRGFRKECIAEKRCSCKSFLMNFGVDLCRFLGALRADLLENKLENTTIFSNTSLTERK